MAVALKAAGVDVEVGVLAEEAQLVLGPWLFAQEAGRPFVTAVYGPDDHDGLSVTVGILDELRMAADAVVFEDGRVEEGVSGQPWDWGVRVVL